MALTKDEQDFFEQEHPIQTRETMEIEKEKTLTSQEIQEIFASLKSTEIEENDFFSFLKKIVNHIHYLVKKEKLDNEYIDNNLGNVSARQILTTGKTFYMNPCLDFVLVTIEGLKRIGIKDTSFVIEELQCPGNQYKLHFGVDIPYQGENYYIDYRTKNDVFLGKGNFQSNYADKNEQVANIIKIDAEDMWSDDTIYTLIEKKLLKFKFFDPKVFDMLKEKLKKDNTNEQRENWFVSKVKNIHQAEIFVETGE